MMKNAVIVVVALMLCLVAFPLAAAGSSYWLSVGANVALLAFVSAGVWLTFAIGRINIGQGAFVLTGGYTLGILTSSLNWPFWLAFPAAGLVAGAVGMLIGMAILRLRGVYFAMLTLCLTQAANLLALNWRGLTGGASGIVNISTPFQGNHSYLSTYYFSVLLLIAGLVVVKLITTCRVGWVFRTIQADEELAKSVGVPVARYRVMAYTLAAVYGGLGGAGLTVFLQSIYPTSFDVTSSTNFMLYCFLGGLRYVAGPAVGAVALFFGFQLFQAFGRYQMLVYATLIIIAMLVLPNGLLSLAFRKAGGFGAIRPLLGLQVKTGTGPRAGLRPRREGT